MAINYLLSYQDSGLLPPRVLGPKSSFLGVEDPVVIYVSPSHAHSNERELVTITLKRRRGSLKLKQDFHLCTK